MEERFSATLSVVSKVITALVLCLAVFIPAIILSTIEEGDPKIWIPYVTCAGLLLLSAVMFAYMPRYYIITPYRIAISRLAGDKVFDLSEVKSMRIVSPKEMGFAIRTFGNGGLFGFTGHYYSDNIGNMRWYVTNRQNFVLFQLANKRQIVVTPDDPAAFIAAFERHVKNMPK